MKCSESLRKRTPSRSPSPSGPTVAAGIQDPEQRPLCASHPPTQPSWEARSWAHQATASTKRPDECVCVSSDPKNPVAVAVEVEIRAHGSSGSSHSSQVQNGTESRPMHPTRSSAPLATDAWFRCVARLHLFPLCEHEYSASHRAPHPPKEAQDARTIKVPRLCIGAGGCFE